MHQFMTTDATRLVAHVSRAKLALVTVFCSLGAMATAYNALERGAGFTPEGWLGAIFLTGCALLSTGRMFRTTPALVLDLHGLEDLSGGYGFIPWQDVTAFWESQNKSNVYLNLELANSEVYSRRLPVWRRLPAALGPLAGQSRISFDVSYLTAGSEEILARVRTACPGKERGHGIQPRLPDLS